MDFIHIRSLEKYHPGYKDRTLQWGKIHFRMVQGDPDCELITNEIDWGRLIRFILLELEAQKPIPLDTSYLTKKGFDLKKRPISLTIQMLHNFIEVIHGDVGMPTDTRHVDKEKEEDKDKEKEEDKSAPLVDFFNYYLLKTKRSFRLTDSNRALIEKRLGEGFTVDQLKTAVDNFVADDWPDRHKHLELIYCIGQQKGRPDNLEKWLNKPKTSEVDKWRK